MIRRLTTMGRLAPLAWSQPRFPFRDLADIERVRDRRIAGITEHAYREVPHYREEIERLGLAPEDIRTPADLARLPLLSREQVQREGERLTSRNLGEKGISFSSSGSTGTPMTTVWDHRAPMGLPGEQLRVAGRNRNRDQGLRDPDERRLAAAIPDRSPLHSDA